MKLVLVGIQGSGKSTQGNLLSHQLHLPYLSTGHIFRRIAHKKTKLGRYVKTLLATGTLIPDEQTIEIVNDYLSQKEYSRGYILDGFPRTIEQAKKFKNNVDRVIYVEIPEKEAIWRLAHRPDEDRDDNTIQALGKRIALFQKLSTPVLKYYEKQEKLITIDGTASIEAINKEILRSLGKQFIKNQLLAWSQKKKAIVAIVGLSGSGKTAAAEYFKKEKKLPVVSFGQVVNQLVEERGHPHDEDHHKAIREELRGSHGMEALAVLNKSKIAEALKKSAIVVIDGLYSWEEYLYLKKSFKNVKIYLLALIADKKLRYRRVARRKYRPRLSSQERDINELENTNKGAAIAFADFVVKNNFSIEDLDDKLEDVYRKIYFS